MSADRYWTWQHSLIVCALAVLLNVAVGAAACGAERLGSFLNDLPSDREPAPKQPAITEPDSQPLVSMTQEARQ